jgi:hypothetical protein
MDHKISITVCNLVDLYNFKLLFQKLKGQSFHRIPKRERHQKGGKNELLPVSVQAL